MLAVGAPSSSDMVRAHEVETALSLLVALQQIRGTWLSRWEPHLYRASAGRTKLGDGLGASECLGVEAFQATS